MIRRATVRGRALPLWCCGEFVSDQAYSDIVAAADAVLLPYRKITGSAVLLAAWTLGRGVVASDLPYFREMADGEPESAHFSRRVTRRH